MVQAAFFDRVSFDPFAFEQDGLSASKVDVGGSEIVEALMVTAMIVMLDEGRDLGFKVLLEEVVFKQDAVLQRLVPAFDFPLRLRVAGSAVNLVDLVFLQPFAEIRCDVTRTVAPTEGRVGATSNGARSFFAASAHRLRWPWPVEVALECECSQLIPERPTMTSQNSIPADAVLVAIDIAKVRNEVLIEAPGHKRRRRLSVLNTRAEHDHLIAILQSYDRPVVCAFEATGNYHRPIAWRLVEAGFETRLVSSLALARTREALHNSWDKNDPKDAQVILHMLRIHSTQVYHDPLRAGINDVQELSKTHEAIANAKTEIQHRILTHYLPLYFPEIERFRGNSRSDWFFAFLDAFPTPSSITTLTKEKFVEAAWDVVGRKVSKSQILMDIYETARTSIGLPLPLDAPAIRMFRMVVAEARSLIRQRNEIEAQADDLLRNSRDYQILRQIPGIGPINALTIIAEAGDLRRFHHHRQFLKFCGLDLSTQQSGQYRGQTRLSKFGNARLRRTLWIAGQVAIRQRENGFRHKFERYIARDRDNPDLRRKAMTAITAKMARVVHAVVKSGSDYRPFVEGRVPGGRTSVS